MSLFITFEGCEGCGKTFQSKALYKKLCQLGISAELTYEPGGTALGDEVRHLLKRRRQDIVSPEAEVFLFAACRVNLITEVIQPDLRAGKVVICDRFADSTTVYQGYGRGVDLTAINTIHKLATRGVKPDLTVLLDISPEEGLSRRRAKDRDRFEQESLAFHKRVRAGYLELAGDEPERWLVIDATLPKIEISKIIWTKVSNMLSRMQDIPEHG